MIPGSHFEYTAVQLRGGCGTLLSAAATPLPTLAAWSSNGTPFLDGVQPEQTGIGIGCRRAQTRRKWRRRRSCARPVTIATFPSRSASSDYVDRRRRNIADHNSGDEFDETLRQESRRRRPQLVQGPPANFYNLLACAIP